MTASYANLRYESQDRIVRITIDRPEKRNALSQELLLQLLDALDRAAAEPDACSTGLMVSVGYSGSGSASSNSRSSRARSS